MCLHGARWHGLWATVASYARLTNCGAARVATVGLTTSPGRGHLAARRLSAAGGPRDKALDGGCTLTHDGGLEGRTRRRQTTTARPRYIRHGWARSRERGCRQTWKTCRTSSRRYFWPELLVGCCGTSLSLFSSLSPLSRAVSRRTWGGPGKLRPRTVRAGAPPDVGRAARRRRPAWRHRCGHQPAPRHISPAHTLTLSPSPSLSLSPCLPSPNQPPSNE